MNPFEPPKSELWQVPDTPAPRGADADNVAQLASILVFVALLVTTSFAIVFAL